MPRWDGKTPQQRFNERYVIDTATGCWNWNAGLGGRGYAYMWDGRASVQAYRLAWIWKNGPIPASCDLHHKCENKACVNPDHVEPLPRKEHILKHDSVIAIHARASQCPKGHQFTGDNLVILNALGHRRCRACHNLNERKRLKMKRGRLRVDGSQ